MKLDPNANHGKKFTSIFIRSGGSFFASQPNDTSTHQEDDLAKEHGLLNTITQQKDQKSVDVDGGQVLFNPPNELVFFLSAISLGLPAEGVEAEAREITVQVARNLFSRFKVRGNIEK